MPSTSEKMAIVTPIPRARVRTTVSVKPGVLTSWRNAKRKLRASVYMHPPRGFASTQAIRERYTPLNWQDEELFLIHEASEQPGKAVFRAARFRFRLFPSR